MSSGVICSKFSQLLVSRLRQRFSTVATEGIGSKVVRGIDKQVEEKVMKTSSEASGSCSWVPDPVTGYYRPENKAVEVDPAELRKVLLKSRHH
ncbi:hypothetical protein FRX31_014290 [Thalictrum thalictroides]|uniref:Late embryogenesis abundant protein n=1 Tax=Thalictrum thalictroides TaxID=46969 RepID=A0A7J6WF93_THATH|nr:hypothetical protein FRX31_014290 [Thalictrum thalictroides]